jgi:hypothetical protein
VGEGNTGPSGGRDRGWKGSGEGQDRRRRSGGVAPPSPGAHSRGPSGSPPAGTCTLDDLRRSGLFPALVVVARAFPDATADHHVRALCLLVFESWTAEARFALNGIDVAREELSKANAVRSAARIGEATVALGKALLRHTRAVEMVEAFGREFARLA